jgi:hypothetical protein
MKKASLPGGKAVLKVKAIHRKLVEVLRHQKNMGLREGFITVKSGEQSKVNGRCLQN